MKLNTILMDEKNKMNRNVPDNCSKRNEWFIRKKVNLSRCPKKIPKRLKSPLEMVKYFTSHTSLHGIKYGDDEQLYRIERVIWIFLVIVGFYCTIVVIQKLNEKFQSRQTDIVIDDLNYHITNVPFPSVTICPGSRIDWSEVDKLLDSILPTTNEDARHIFNKLLQIMSQLDFSRLHRLYLNANTSTFDLLDNINMTEIMIRLLPKCNEFLFKCSWLGEPKNCCDIFQIEKTNFGLCYSFNSLTTIHQDLNETYSTVTYGIRGGLRLSIRNDNMDYPSDYKDNRTVFYYLSHPRVNPKKSRFITFGMRYNIDFKFKAIFASDDVIELEGIKNPPCRYENGNYLLENCLRRCTQEHIFRICGCNPDFFYHSADNMRECNITDLRCLSDEGAVINKGYIQLSNGRRETLANNCNCPPTCNDFIYEDFIIGLPHTNPNITVLDFHFDGPVGIRYKRDVVVSNLDILVQIGGIFGLFLGGSVLTFAEFIYCFTIGLIFFIYRHMICNNNKKQVKVSQVIHVPLYDDKRIYPLLDFPMPSRHKLLKY